ncbi:GNAT family N-acetyltransferase [Achromobacter ruhlandii]|uniref:GNAT family N-acetyltransferase n=1 Tax=Achromobacter ruhlandii TaxID=72557 RepID=UPI003B9C0DBC
MRHKAHVWSVYVAPPWRGRGLARLLKRAAPRRRSRHAPCAASSVCAAGPRR